VVLWGLLCAAVAIGGYLLARHFRRTWVGVLVAIVPFVVALYFFFQNVNRLLPAAI
jgi:sortase A